MEKEEHIDKELVEAFKAGDNKALTLLVKRWHRVFCEKAYWLVKDKDVAKDIAQESWTTIIQKMDKLKNPESFKYWAFRIVCNKATDWMRLRTKHRQHSLSYGIEIEIKDELYTENNTLKTELLKAINQLPQNQKIILKLFYIEDYSIKNISEIMNLSIGTVKSRLFHAREKLKKTLKM